MHVQQLWRYPVKSMRGEALTEAVLDSSGIAGDRVIHVTGSRGLVTARRKPGLLGLPATTGAAGEVLVAGHPWDSARATQLVAQAAGPDAQLVAFAGPGRFDVLPLLVATDGAIAAFGRDGRRLRPNIVIGGVEGLAERDWEGAALMIGSVLIRLDSLRQRCVMTTFDPDTLQRDGGVLRDIHRRFAGTLALNAEVLAAGRVRVVDPVRLSTGGGQAEGGRGELPAG